MPQTAHKLFLWITLAGLQGLLQGFGADGRIEFNRDIRPVLSENCFQCHGPDVAQRKGGLRLDNEDGATQDLGGYAAIVPGNPEASALVARILEEDPEEIMPPADSKKQLTAGQKNLLKEWIVQGALWQEHWAFEPPVKVPLPSVSDEGWCRNEIDHFILHRLEREGLRPSAEASKTTLIRRVTLDLTGLPPTPEEVDAFLADRSAEAYDRLVRRLLGSRRYGEHMAWQWLEAARYADTDGYQNDGPREVWRWRDWVIDAYNRNLPFDRFTIEQLAGDLLPNPTLDQVIATGFNRNHRYNSEAGLVFEEFLLENAVDRVDTTSTVWMGLTLGCARCHDHKYDPISQKEYYQLVAYFNSIPESGRAIKFGNSEPWIKAPTREHRDRLTVLDGNVEAAQKALSRAEAQIVLAQKRWEPGLVQDGVVVQTGLTHHFARDNPIQTDGVKGVALEKIPGLICNGRFTIAFRMTPQDISDGAILSNEGANSTRQGVLVSVSEGHLCFSIISRWISGVATLETMRRFEPNQSIHITLTNDGTQRAKGMRIYIDGVPVATRVLHNSNSNKSGENHGGKMQVGASHHLAAWRGEVRDLRFYISRTLSEKEARILAEPMTVKQIAAIESNRRTESQAEKLRAYFLEHDASESLKSHESNLRAAEVTRQNYYDALPTTMVMEEMSLPKPTHVRRRGVYHQLGERVGRGVPGVFPAMPIQYPNNRLGFAKWLVNGDHPLTARVAVNRYWQLIFGRGLVNTAEDFGVQGSPPSHPELLDWLAVDFVESGWDLQHVLYSIVTSATYRQDSAVTRTHRERDPENRLLARASRQRLSGNVLRDQALLVSGLLVEREGGPSVKPYQPAKLWREASNFVYQVGEGEDLYRRSLYTYWKRTLAPPSMAVLDTADREWCSVTPKRTNTPLQALTLLNETTFFEAALKLGERMLALENRTAAQRIEFAFRVVAARFPTTHERAILSDAFESYHAEFAAHPEKAAEVLRVGESIATASADIVDLAAAAALANVLLNLDEVTTRE